MQDSLNKVHFNVSFKADYNFFRHVQGYKFSAEIKLVKDSEATAVNILYLEH